MKWCTSPAVLVADQTRSVELDSEVLTARTGECVEVQTVVSEGPGQSRVALTPDDAEIGKYLIAAEAVETVVYGKACTHALRERRPLLLPHGVVRVERSTAGLIVLKWHH